MTIAKLAAVTALAAMSTGALVAIAPAQAQPSEMAVSVIYAPELTERFADEYGDRESAALEGILVRRLSRTLGDRVARVSVEITDAKPNRPTMAQMSKRPGLSFQSFGIGGAALSGTAFAADGTELATVSYRWFENDVRQSAHESTWGDATQAFSRFATRLAQAID